MDTNRAAPKTSAAFEYFLYVAIIVETALAAFVYKVIFRDPDFVRFNVVFGIFYCAFLGWSILQLNQLYRNRKLKQEEALPNEVGEPQPEHTRAVLGLTGAQFVIVVVVFVTAVATFSWALKLLR